MIRIEQEAWEVMVPHAQATYPHECCGAMLGREEDGVKRVVRARKMRNISSTNHGDSYELDPKEQFEVDKEARAAGLDVIGIYHSHPDCDAYFSRRDLANSCSWYSFVVLSNNQGKLDHENSWLPNEQQTEAAKEELVHP